MENHVIKPNLAAEPPTRTEKKGESTTRPRKPWRPDPNKGNQCQHSSWRPTWRPSGTATIEAGFTSAHFGCDEYTFTGKEERERPLHVQATGGSDVWGWSPPPLQIPPTYGFAVLLD